MMLEYLGWKEAAELLQKGLTETIKQKWVTYDLDEAELVLIENVGNLICPSGFNLGEDYRVVILSIPEGDDKPKKYPAMFRKADVVILSKIDLLQYSNFDRQRFYEDLKKINAGLKTFELSALTGDGVQHWLQWLENVIAHK